MAQQYQVGKHATTIHTENGTIRVIYHETPVVSFDKGLIILDTGGYRTNTTKTRMNQASHQFGLGFSVYQKDWDWFVSYQGDIIPFDGETLALNRS